MSSTKTTIQNRRDLKYLKALQSLKETLDNGDQVTLTNWARDNKLNLRIGSVLTDKKIIVNLGVKSRPYYQWSSIPPNLKMVEALVLEVLKLNILHGSRSKNKQVSPKNISLYQLREIVNLRDNKNYTFPRIAKIYGFSEAQLTKIYYSCIGKENYFKTLNTELRETIQEYRVLEKTPNTSKVKAKPIKAKTKVDTIKVAPRMHPVVESKQKSIVILWGLINIKF